MFTSTTIDLSTDSSEFTTFIQEVYKTLQYSITEHPEDENNYQNMATYIGKGGDHAITYSDVCIQLGLKSRRNQAVTSDEFTKTLLEKFPVLRQYWTILPQTKVAIQVTQNVSDLKPTKPDKHAENEFTKVTGRKSAKLSAPQDTSNSKPSRTSNSFEVLSPPE